MKRIISVVFVVMSMGTALLAQEKIIDRIVAVVGDNIILQSDIENQYLQMKAQGYNSGGDMKCEVFEDLLVQKLMLAQAKVDSIEVTQAEVEQSLDMQIQGFIERAGGQDKLEAYYQKTILEIKDDFRDVIRNQMLTQRMQAKIAEDINVTPSEIKSFYRNLPKDSLPIIPKQIEYRKLIRKPPYNEESKIEVRKKLLDLRKRVMEGQNFTTLAILYSEDPGSARLGGELGFKGKGELDKDYFRAASAMKEGGISQIVETQFGFHIIQLIERKGEKINTRHILMKPKITMEETKEVFDFFDSTLVKLSGDSLSFKEAVFRYSQDEDSRLSGGVAINPNTGDTRFQLDQLDPATARAVQDMKEGDISKSFETMGLTGERIFMIIELTRIIEPHKANMKLDYSILQEMTRGSKQQEVFQEWIEEKQQTTYIRIDESYQGCQFRNKYWVK